VGYTPLESAPKEGEKLKKGSHTRTAKPPQISHKERGAPPKNKTEGKGTPHQGKNISSGTKKEEGGPQKDGGHLGILGEKKRASRKSSQKFKLNWEKKVKPQRKRANYPQPRGSEKLASQIAVIPFGAKEFRKKART